MSAEGDNLARVAEDVSRALVSSAVHGGSAFVTMPVTYPSGASAVIRLDSHGDRWFVSDDGYGQLEAEMIGGLVPFRSAARSAANRAGVDFDGRSFFLVNVDQDTLPGAVTTIANVSQRAVIRAAVSVEERRIAVSRSVFEERLASAFQGDAIHRQAPFAGQSGKEWEIDALIERRGVVVGLFEFVTPRPASVAAAVMKLTDIRALPQAPRSAAVLSDLARTDPHLVSLLSRVAGRAFAANENEAAYRKAA